MCMKLSISCPLVALLCVILVKAQSTYTADSGQNPFQRVVFPDVQYPVPSERGTDTSKDIIYGINKVFDDGARQRQEVEAWIDDIRDKLRYSWTVNSFGSSDQGRTYSSGHRSTGDSPGPYSDEEMKYPFGSWVPQTYIERPLFPSDTNSAREGIPYTTDHDHQDNSPTSLKDHHGLHDAGKTFVPCTEEFFFTYDYDFSGPVWQGVKGHVVVANGEAVFRGQGSLVVPFFSCNDLLPRYSMRFVISPDLKYQQGPMAVLGNSLDPSKSSLSVVVSGYSLSAVLRPRYGGEHPYTLAKHCLWKRRRRRAADYPAHTDKLIILSAPIKPGPNVVTLIQEDGHIFLFVNDQMDYALGNLPLPTDEPLYIGAGSDPVRDLVLPLYKGTFDSFVFEKCPRRLLVRPHPLH